MPYKQLWKTAGVLLLAGVVVMIAGTILMGGTWEPLMEGSDAWYRVIHINK